MAANQVETRLKVTLHPHQQHTNPKDSSKITLQSKNTEQIKCQVCSRQSVVSMSNFLLFKIIFIFLAERNEKLMGLIKEKQKDIILFLKDQFFFFN